MEKKFPKDFLWGVAHSSHQVEGNCKENDWWDWEQKGKTKESSGWACDSWNRYPVDNKLAQDLGCGAFRLSFEWSKIEPKRGEFSKDAIEHYRKLLQDLKKRGVKRVVTLCHWTLPMWFVGQGGWTANDAPKIFSSYCEKIIEELGDEIDLFVTLNEPTIPLNKGYLVGLFPPGRRNPLAFFRARKNMIKAHGLCYDVIKRNKPELSVGITQFCNTFEAVGILKIFSFLVRKFESTYNWGFVTSDLDKHDFWGIDYYATFVFSIKPPFVTRKTTNDRWTDMKWGIYPEGIYNICMQAKKTAEKPIYIFENGLADAKDKYRADFIKEHLEYLQKALGDGADLKGYFYWSLLDNFEWNQGYGPKFGLCEIDGETMERIPRKSYFEYKKLIVKYKKEAEESGDNIK